ncbi:MAG: Asp-tRNA(Asn)/Glu-tRNA(Gln) amidotransferase subunit GatA [Desulfobacterales bacterium]
MTLNELTITEAATRLENGEISAEKLTADVLDRIAEWDSAIGAFITVDREGAMAQARAADAMRSRGDGTPLTGIPVALKDVLCTRGIPTTCGSKILEHFVPPYDADVVERLKAAGAVLVGKTNMDEFAMGSSTENSAFHVTRNPWNRGHVPGGSSGGSAAAVAADMCLAALGSDTGGSIRQPASHCGVVGMKPTYGRVSRYGLVAYASSLDQIGPIGKSVADCALLLEAIAGHDNRDSTSVPEAVPPYSRLLETPISGLTIGIPEEVTATEGMDPEVETVFLDSLRLFTSLGARVRPISLPHSDMAVAAYYVIAPCEASSNLARYDGVRYGFRSGSTDDLIPMYHATRSAGFGLEVQRRILLGTFALSAGYYDAYYRKASQVRTRIIDDFRKAFENCDVIAAPVAPTPAFKIGEKVDDPLTMYLSDMFTLSANLAGIPGISVPSGFSTEGLPIGIQIMGRHFDEATLLRAASQFENAAALDRRKPQLKKGA